MSQEIGLSWLDGSHLFNANEMGPNRQTGTITGLADSTGGDQAPVRAFLTWSAHALVWTSKASLFAWQSQFIPQVPR